jgi:hypothetical protein
MSLRGPGDAPREETAVSGGHSLPEMRPAHPEPFLGRVSDTGACRGAVPHLNGHALAIVSQSPPANFVPHVSRANQERPLPLREASGRARVCAADQNF